MYKFRVKDLDRERLDKLIEEETDSIFNSPNARGGRSRGVIRRFVAQGKAPELYLVEKHGFSFAENLYDDVMIGDQFVEVKAWVPRNIKKNLIEFNKRCRDSKYFQAETLFIFTPNNTYDEYEFYGAYKWRKRKWTKV